MINICTFDKVVVDLTANESEHYLHNYIFLFQLMIKVSEKILFCNNSKEPSKPDQTLVIFFV